MAVGAIPRLGGGHYRFSLALDTGGANNTTANYRLLATATDKSLGYTLRTHDNCKTSLRYVTAAPGSGFSCSRHRPKHGK